MGRYDLKHIDRGVIYIHVDDNVLDQEINKTIEEHKKLGHTIVLFRSGKNNMKNILKEWIGVTINT